MALEIPSSAAEVENRSKTDVQRELPISNPFLKNHWLGAIITSNANRTFDFYLQLQEAITQSFIDTATGSELERLAAIWGIDRIAATQATGNVVASGTAGGIVPLGTVLTGSNGNYTTTNSATLAASQISVTSIVRSGQTATATTASNHNLANNVPVTISGAVETEYNVTDAAITVTGLNTFQYQITGSPGTPATGTLLADFTAATVPVQSNDFGDALNLDAGAQLTLQSVIVNVDSVMAVDFGAIGGGTDIESDADLRTRALDRIQNPVAHFNVSDVVAKAKEIAGVTRVFVESATDNIGTVSVTSITRNGQVATVTTASNHGLDDGQVTDITGAIETDYNVVGGRIIVESDTIFHYVVPGSPTTPATGTILASTAVALGQLRVFFMRDNDENPIPTASEVTTVKNQILTIKPANTADADVIVSAPTGVSIDFTFTALAPNTSTMRSAIEANLLEFFAESTDIGVDVDEDAYRSAIFNTVDTVTGDTVLTFTLSTPTTDITITSGEIGILGNVVFS